MAMAKCYLPLILCWSLTALTLRADTKTWIGPDGGFWGAAANWDPLGVPLITDDVLISGFGGTIVINTLSSATFVQSLNIVNGSAVIFSGNNTARRITISCMGCNSGVESGCDATFTGGSGSQACDLYFLFSPNFVVDGTLTFTGTGNSDLIAAGATITVNGNLIFSGTGNSRLVCSGGITNINGYFIYSGGGTTSGESPSNLFINSNAVFELARNGSGVPNAHWDGNSLLKISGMTDNDPSFVNGTVFGNLSWSCPFQEAPANIDADLTFNRVDIYDTGSSEIRIASTNANQTRTWTVNGDYTQSNGIVNFSSGNNATGKILFKGGNFYSVMTLTETSSNGKGVVEFAGAQQQSAYFGIVENSIDIVINCSKEVLLNTAAQINEGATLHLLSGNLVTSTQNMLTISAGAGVAGGSISSHIIGPLRKVGNSAFTFPLGKGTTYAPIAISAPAAATDTFTAEYFNAPYVNTNDISSPLVRVSKLEYWQLQQNSGSSAVHVTLHWQDGSASGINDLNSLAVARFNGSSWVDIGGAASGTVTTGNIQSDTTSIFSWFTFGAISAAFNPLPVTLQRFEAERRGNIVQLYWQTATENANAFFAVERSVNGVGYTEIGRVTGAGYADTPRSYDFTDSEPAAGINYYRLRQIDFDGAFSFSPVRTVLIPKTDHPGIFPSPAADRLHVQVDRAGAQDAPWYIYDTAGRLLRSGVLPSGAREVEIDVNSLAPGHYVLHLMSGGSETACRFVKQ